ncbi:histidine phosphatase family protein [Pantoea sp. Cy-639]|uniref:lipopolysaccharide core heptose(II)-phosphate phosphatase PmrG n=1 Tax=Pantoea sp. Cy-639 TaxID=2608360 RepID=UPI00141E58BD|nr:histidine phosphatase family protein [Pantoea sp. Cy-639]NIF15420.1 histidine phosphatase family protein [Pantoea sp. Cy-639]
MGFEQVVMARGLGRKWKVLAVLLIVAGLGLWGVLEFCGRLSLQVDPDVLEPAWTRGEVVVLVRHEERCDRSDNPCLGAKDGITEQGRLEALRLGAAYRSLGLAGSEVVYSPRLRTEQTARAMFGNEGDEQTWAADCTGDVLLQLRSHKEPGRNLVAVTHSECIQRALDQLGVDVDDYDVGYGASLFLQVQDDGSLKPMALVAAADWIGYRQGPVEY